MINFIIYVVIQIRFDICFIVIILSRYNQNPNLKYIIVVKRIIRYLKDTLIYNIIYNTNNRFLNYTNAD